MSPLLDGWDNGARLTDTSQRKARYGVAYLKNVCAQFGVPMQETSPDEDIGAVDAWISFQAAEVRVQVKCTSRTFTQNDPHLTIPLKPDWIQTWRASRIPVYLLAVHVPNNPADWMSYDSEHKTLHHTAAYWERVDSLPVEHGSSVFIPRTNRFTPETIRDWNQDLIASFTGGAP